MRSVTELTDKELRQAYVSARKRYKEVRKEKVDLEDEMARRFEKDLEENRCG